ncbi:hypothetical protein VHA01S_003_02830 [Vibrio halioticoli NBRC 102217]|uniref:BON domain-containing protein n=1 Tax=Vibrio halioticoli NBRC 102217 TaxID=1219072 RepID=V5FGM1_9VIBR|nr:BON domain-containing protein [Vibrio halioticoli]GAD88207.1 hypothetical protein VHA01S_003_02830 [Vibrio halioticoli NBRC 102217]
MLYTRKPFLYIITLMACLMTAGCSNMLVSDASVVTDNRSAREVWDDNNIEFEAAALGNKAPFAGKVRVAANSFRGKVVLIGQAPTEELHQQIGKRVADIPGVKKVYNQLRIQPTINLSQMSQDSWITTKVKSALLGESKLRGISIKVVTENREVFLFGYVDPKSADIATETARNVSGVKLVIRGFEIADVATTTNDVKNTPTSSIAAPTTEASSQENEVQGNKAQDDSSTQDGTIAEDDAVMGGDVIIDRTDDIVEEPVAE